MGIFDRAGINRGITTGEAPAVLGDQAIRVISAAIVDVNGTPRLADNITATEIQEVLSLNVIDATDNGDETYTFTARDGTTFTIDISAFEGDFAGAAFDGNRGNEYRAGDIVTYNNEIYINRTGNASSTTPDGDRTNWLGLELAEIGGRLWSTAISYSAGDIVTTGSGTTRAVYIAVRDNTDVDPLMDTDNSDWVLFESGGAGGLERWQPNQAYAIGDVFYSDETQALFGTNNEVTNQTWYVHTAINANEFSTFTSSLRNNRLTRLSIGPEVIPPANGRGITVSLQPVDADIPELGSQYEIDFTPQFQTGFAYQIGDVFSTTGDTDFYPAGFRNVICIVVTPIDSSHFTFSQTVQNSVQTIADQYQGSWAATSDYVEGDVVKYTVGGTTPVADREHFFIANTSITGNAGNSAPDMDANWKQITLTIGDRLTQTNGVLSADSQVSDNAFANPNAMGVSTESTTIAPSRFRTDTSFLELAGRIAALSTVPTGTSLPPTTGDNPAVLGDLFCVIGAANLGDDGYYSFDGTSWVKDSLRRGVWNNTSAYTVAQIVARASGTPSVTRFYIARSNIAAGQSAPESNAEWLDITASASTPTNLTDSRLFIQDAEPTISGTADGSIWIETDVSPHRLYILDQDLDTPAWVRLEGGGDSAPAYYNLGVSPSYTHDAITIRRGDVIVQDNIAYEWLGVDTTSGTKTQADTKLIPANTAIPASALSTDYVTPTTDTNTGVMSVVGDDATAGTLDFSTGSLSRLQVGAFGANINSLVQSNQLNIQSRIQIYNSSIDYIAGDYIFTNVDGARGLFWLAVVANGPTDGNAFQPTADNNGHNGTTQVWRLLGDGGTGGGDTYDIQVDENATVNTVDLTLDAATGTDSTVTITGENGVSIVRNSGTQFTIGSTQHPHPASLTLTATQNGNPVNTITVPSSENFNFILTVTEADANSSITSVRFDSSISNVNFGTGTGAGTSTFTTSATVLAAARDAAVAGNTFHITAIVSGSFTDNGTTTTYSDVRRAIAIRFIDIPALWYADVLTSIPSDITSATSQGDFGIGDAVTLTGRAGGTIYIWIPVAESGNIDFLNRTGSYEIQSTNLGNNAAGTFTLFSLGALTAGTLTVRLGRL